MLSAGIHYSIPHTYGHRLHIVEEHKGFVRIPNGARSRGSSGQDQMGVVYLRPARSDQSGWQVPHIGEGCGRDAIGYDQLLNCADEHRGGRIHTAEH